MSAFSVAVSAPTILDLTLGELAQRREARIHPTDYAATQQLAADARAFGVMAIRAPSARRRAGFNLAVLDPVALVPPPKPYSSWAFTAADGGLIATREMSATAGHLPPPTAA